MSIVELEKPIRLNFKTAGVNRGIQEFRDLVEKLQIKGKCYQNEIRIHLHDSSGSPLSSGGHLVSAESIGGAEVLSVTDMGTGEYRIIFTVSFPYLIQEREATFTPEIDILLDGTRIFGSPFRLKIQNTNEIIDLYDKIDELYRLMSPEGNVQRLLEMQNPIAAAHEISDRGEEDQKLVNRRLSELQKAAEELAATDVDGSGTVKWLTEMVEGRELTKDKSDLDLEVDKAVRGLQQRWLMMQDFRCVFKLLIQNTNS